MMAGREVGKRHVCERGGGEEGLRAEVFSSFFLLSLGSLGSLGSVAAPNVSPNDFWVQFDSVHPQRRPRFRSYALTGHRIPAQGANPGN